jgi:hypothetical protein
MVVYLYKKGRQTMKNIITTIAMFILTITAQAQDTVILDSMYFFKHDRNISTLDAVNNKKAEWYGHTYESQMLIFDKEKNKIYFYDYNDVLVATYDITKKINEGNEVIFQFKGKYENNQNVVGEFIFTYDTNGNRTLVSKRMFYDERNVHYCYMSKIKKGGF